KTPAKYLVVAFAEIGDILLVSQLEVFSLHYRLPGFPVIVGRINQRSIQIPNYSAFRIVCHKTILIHTHRYSIRPSAQIQSDHADDDRRASLILCPKLRARLPERDKTSPLHTSQSNLIKHSRIHRSTFLLFIDPLILARLPAFFLDPFAFAFWNQLAMFFTG